MNKKATVVLLISSIGFLITALLFLDYTNKFKVGELEFNLIETADKGEAVMFFLEQAAKNSLQEALEDKFELRKFCKANERSCKPKLKELFEKYFDDYIKMANENYGIALGYDFSYSYSLENEQFEINGTSNEIIFPGETFTYKIRHKFNVFS